MIVNVHKWFCVLAYVIKAWPELTYSEIITRYPSPSPQGMLCINNAQIIIMQCCSSRLQVMGGGVVLVSTYAGFAPRMIDTYLKFIFECFNTSFCSHKHTEQLQDKCKNILLGLHIWIMHVLCIEFRKTAPPLSNSTAENMVLIRGKLWKYQESIKSHTIFCGGLTWKQIRIGCGICLPF